jgi:hypothetical protein
LKLIKEAVDLKNPEDFQVHLVTLVSRIWQINTDDGSIARVVASDPRSDLMPFRFDPSKVLFMDFRTKEFLAVAFVFEKLKWKVLHPR